MGYHRKIAIWAGQLATSFNSSSFLSFSSATTTGSGSSSLIGSTGSFDILIFGFAFAFALDFVLTGLALCSSSC